MRRGSEFRPQIPCRPSESFSRIYGHRLNEPMTRTEKHANPLVLVRTYAYRHEAELARSILEANSVQAIISADDFGGVHPMLGAAWGVKLLVRQSDERKAKKLLG